MKVFPVLKPSSFPNVHPQEDYFLISKKHPIFVVADGVSLNFDDDKNYPSHSGAGEVAKIFCEAIISEAEKKYDNFKKEDMAGIFDLADKAVGEYNNSQGRTKNTINYWDVDLFSATTSFLLIKNNKAFWWTLCDSGVVLFNKKGKQLFISSNSWDVLDKFISKKFGNITGKERSIILHRDFRNNPAANGYGVVTGEETAKSYLNMGTLDINSGDLIFLYTDGFENYFTLKEFIGLFKSWPEDIGARLESIVKEKSEMDPAKYGSEKTLIAIAN